MLKEVGIAHYFQKKKKIFQR